MQNLFPAVIVFKTGCLLLCRIRTRCYHGYKEFKLHELINKTWLINDNGSLKTIGPTTSVFLANFDHHLSCNTSVVLRLSNASIYRTTTLYLPSLNLSCFEGLGVQAPIHPANFTFFFSQIINRFIFLNIIF